MSTDQLNHCFQEDYIIRLLKFCIIFVYTCINGLPTYMHVYHVYTVPAEEAVRSLGTGVTED